HPTLRQRPRRAVFPRGARRGISRGKGCVSLRESIVYLMVGGACIRGLRLNSGVCGDQGTELNNRLLGELPRDHALDDAKITRTDFLRHGTNFQLELLFCGMHLAVASERLLGGHVLQGVSFCNFGMRRDFCMGMSVSKRMIPVRRRVP